MTKAELEAAISSRETIFVVFGLVAALMGAFAGIAKFQHMNLSRELRALNGPRKLSDGSKEALRKALSPFAGQTLNVFIFMTDTETATFGSQLVKTLEACGWKLNVSAGREDSARIITGVSLEEKTTATGRDKEAARALVSALSSVNIGAHGPHAAWLGASARSGSINDNPAAQIEMMIATKP
jgi:hypothetical protein